MELTEKSSVLALFLNSRNLTTFDICTTIIYLFDFLRELVLLIYNLQKFMPRTSECICFFLFYLPLALLLPSSYISFHSWLLLLLVLSLLFRKTFTFTVHFPSYDSRSILDFTIYLQGILLVTVFSPFPFPLSRGPCSDAFLLH